MTVLRLSDEVRAAAASGAPVLALESTIFTHGLPRPTNLRDLLASGWQSKSVKAELHDNFLRMLAAGDELFPGIVGFEHTVGLRTDGTLAAWGRNHHGACNVPPLPAGVVPTTSTVGASSTAAGLTVSPSWA